MHDGSERSDLLCQLFEIFDERFDKSSHWDDREKSVIYGYEALAHMTLDDMRRPRYVEGLAVMLFELHGGSRRVPVEEAIEMAEWTYELSSAGSWVPAKHIWRLGRLT